MASATAPCPPAASLSSSQSYHPSPAPSSSPTSSTSSQSLRKRKRDEYLADPIPLVISPHPSSIENNVPASSTMYPFQIFTSIWGTLKGLAGIVTPPSSEGAEVEAPELPSKRVCVDRSSDEEDAASDDQRNKEPITPTSGSAPTQDSNKEAPRSQTNNSRASLKIKASASMGRQTPPTQQLPSPLASSSEDEGETIFKKSPRPVRSLPSKMAAPSVTTGPLEQNEKPFFTKPLLKKRNPEVMLARALSRRGAFSHQRNDPRFPGHTPRPGILRQRRAEPGSIAKMMNFTYTPPDLKATPRPQNEYTLWKSKRTAERRAAYNGRVEKIVKESVRKSQTLNKEFKGEIVVLLKQLAATQTTGFQTLEQVLKQREERTKEIRKMKEQEAAASKTKAEKVPALSLEQQKLVKATYGEARRLAGSGAKTFISKYKYSITHAEIIALHDQSEWLNDEIINFYLAMICERANETGKPPRVAAHNSYFWTTYKKSGYSGVARWAKRKKLDVAALMGLEYLLIPINITVSHWLLMVVNFKERRFEHWDSFGGYNLQKEYFQPLRRYMEAETGADFSDWTDYKMKGAPQQSNGTDCGVFVCKTSEVIARGGPISFTQVDMLNIRHRMIVELLQGSLLPVGSDGDDGDDE